MWLKRSFFLVSHDVWASNLSFCGYFHAPIFVPSQFPGSRESGEYPNGFDIIRIY